jgi:hypothetical protein
MLKYSTFSPIVNGKPLKMIQYVEKYPELKEREDTRDLSGVELIWCWYYGSKESIFVKQLTEKKERAAAVTQYVFDKNYEVHYEEKSKQNLSLGIVPPNWYKAIEFFRNINTDMRIQAKNMVEKIYNQYNDIIDNGVDGFTKGDTVTKDGELIKGEIDYGKYVTTTKMIMERMPELISTIEKGYGTSLSINTDKGQAEELDIYESYIKSKR